VKNINIFCFGFGQVAKNFIMKLHEENFDINCDFTYRKDEAFDPINYSLTKHHAKTKLEYEGYQFSDYSFNNKIISKIKKADYILVSIPPFNGVDIVLKNLKEVLEESKPKWTTYLSSTSVYGDHQGDWVNEESVTNPTSSNGVDRLEVEKSWINFSESINLPLQIFRLSGIYSANDNILKRLKSGNIKIINNKKSNFFSRIHLDDISNVLIKSLSRFKKGEIYNISDDKPASLEEVTLYACGLLDIQKPESIELKNVNSKMLKNFYKNSKKVSNKKMKSFFNYKLKYPTYEEGLSYIRDHLV